MISITGLFVCSITGIIVLLFFFESYYPASYIKKKNNSYQELLSELVIQYIFYFYIPKVYKII